MLLVFSITLLIAFKTSYPNRLYFFFQKSLRHQDITLMRQLININDKIRSMSKDHTTAKNRAKRMRNRTLNVSASINQTTPFSNWQTAIVRQQSVPRYCEVIPEVRERRGSTSSDGKYQIAETFISLTVSTLFLQKLNF